jgi:hypothetical protein
MMIRLKDLRSFSGVGRFDIIHHPFYVHMYKCTRNQKYCNVFVRYDLLRVGTIGVTWRVVMAVRKNLQRSYGFGQPIYDLSPKPIVAQRAPTVHDMAEIGTIWVDQVNDVAYTLIKVAGNQATWGNQAQIGNLVTNLTVNPGPLELLSNVDAAQRFLVDLNGGTSETAEIIVEQGTDLESILLNSVNGGVDITAGVNDPEAITIETTNHGGIFIHADGDPGNDITLRNENGGVTLIAGEAANNAISINAVDVAGGIRIGAGTGGEVHGIADGVFTVITGTGAISISDDATDTTITIGTGAGVKDVAIGSDHTTSLTTITAGTAGIELATGAIAANAGKISMAPLTSSTASPTAAVTMGARVGRATFTGFTTASTASQAFTITNSTVIANSGIFVTVQNTSGGNDCQMTLDSVVTAVGSFVVNTTNNGTQALDGNVIITFWVIS